MTHRLEPRHLAAAFALALVLVGCAGAAPPPTQSPPAAQPAPHGAPPPAAAPPASPRTDPVLALAAVYYDAADGIRGLALPLDAPSSRPHAEHVARAYEQLGDVVAALALDDSQQRALALAVRQAIADTPTTQPVRVINLPSITTFVEVAAALPREHPRRADVLCMTATLSLHDSLDHRVQERDLPAEPTALLVRVRDALRSSPGETTVLDAPTLAALRPVAVDLFVVARGVLDACTP